MQQNGQAVIVAVSSGGIGAAVARQLAGSGYRVSLMARSASVFDLASELDGIAWQGSVTDPQDLASCVSATVDAYGEVAGLVCNTGNAPKGELLDISDEDWHAGLDLVLLNSIRLSRLVTPHLLRRGGGSIVHISSFGAVAPSLRFPVSSVMRAGLAAFTKLYTQSYAAQGIRMNSVLPGFMENAPQSPETMDAIPSRRLGRMEELASTIEFLLSPGSAYINGQEILVDGGLVGSI